MKNFDNISKPYGSHGDSGVPPGPHNSVREGDVREKLDLQEAEYRLPAHWLLKKAGLIHYLNKTNLMARLVMESGLVGGRVLDVGCGDGRGTFELSRALGPSFVFEGVDFSDRAIAFARLMAPGIRFETQDGTRLGFDDQTFDLVVAREVIEHVPDPEIPGFLAEILRVLKPSGLALFTTPSTLRKVPPKHFQHFTPESLSRRVEEAGFARVALTGFGWWPSPRLEKFYRFVTSLPSLWRIHAKVGVSEMPPERADCLILLATRQVLAPQDADLRSDPDGAA